MTNESTSARLVGACLVCVLVAMSPSIAKASGNVKYYGGHVISHVQVVPVLWGTGVSPDVVNGVQGFYGTIVNSPYIDWLGEYDTVGLTGTADMMPGSNQHINRGTVSPTVSLVPMNTGTTISDAQIQTELAAQITAGKLPPPQLDPEGGVDTLYMVAFPPGMTINDFGGQDVCSGGCAYHWTFTMPGTVAGVPYGVIPDCSASPSQGCSLGTVLDTYTGDAAHELAEAITDTECGLASATAFARPLAWYDATQAQSGEIGDLCLSATAFVSYMGYTVQTLWSQRLGQCITNDPNLTLCNGTMRPCRPCSASDCTAATPTCDTNMASPTWGQCVGSAPDAGVVSDAGQITGGPEAGRGTGDVDAGQGLGEGDAGQGATDKDSGEAANQNTGGGSSGGCSMTPSTTPLVPAALWLGLSAGLAVFARRRRRAPSYRLRELP
jgi:hypothetical protein